MLSRIQKQSLSSSKSFSINLYHSIALASGIHKPHPNKLGTTILLMPCLRQHINVHPYIKNAVWQSFIRSTQIASPSYYKPNNQYKKFGDLILVGWLAAWMAGWLAGWLGGRTLAELGWPGLSLAEPCASTSPAAAPALLQHQP